MKVLSYIDCLNRGGMETLIADIAKNITKNDFDYYIVSGLGGDLEETVRNSNAEYIRLDRRKSIDIKLIRQLRKIIKSEKVDIIHSHNDVSMFYGYLASIGLGTKRVNTFHGHITGKKEKYVFNVLSNLAQVNLSVSQNFIEDLKKEISIKNVDVLYNGIDDNKFNNFEKKENFKEFNNKGNDFIAGMIGNFTLVKDYYTLCKAIPLVLSKYNSIKFLFIGRRDEKHPEIYDNCYEYCTKNNLLDNVIFMGKREDIPELLNSLDLFILSSNTDTFGIAVIEAMLSKVPCLLSDIPTLKEISDNGKYAKLFRKGNEKDLADKIINFINLKSDSEELTENAYNWAKKNFSIRAHIDNLKSIYTSVIEEK